MQLFEIWLNQKPGDPTTPETASVATQTTSEQATMATTENQTDPVKATSSSKSDSTIQNLTRPEDKRQKRHLDGKSSSKIQASTVCV